jgi:hypothetical protein
MQLRRDGYQAAAPQRFMPIAGYSPATRIRR